VLNTIRCQKSLGLRKTVYNFITLIQQNIPITNNVWSKQLPKQSSNQGGKLTVTWGAKPDNYLTLVCGVVLSYWNLKYNYLNAVIVHVNRLIDAYCIRSTAQAAELYFVKALSTKLRPVGFSMPHQPPPDAWRVIHTDPYVHGDAIV
jgi:hypothetical protein